MKNKINLNNLSNLDKRIRFLRITTKKIINLYLRGYPRSHKENILAEEIIKRVGSMIFSFADKYIWKEQLAREKAYARRLSYELNLIKNKMKEMKEDKW